MKRTLLSMAAFLLSVTAMNAQVAETLKPFKATPKAPVVSMVPGFKSQAPAKAPAKADLAENQKVLGLSGSDQPATSCGLPNYAGKVTRMGSYITASDVTPYAGAKIIGMRIAVTNSIGFNKKAFVQTLTNDGFTDVATATLPNSLEYTTFDSEGNADLKWNTVTFSNPYTITDDKNIQGLVFGYEYTQKGDSKSEASFPILVGVTSSSNGLMAYGDFSNSGTASWSPFSLNDGNGNSVSCALCIQLILEKDGGFIDDIVMDGVATPQFIYTGDNGQVMFACKNLGSKSISDYDFSLFIDGDESKAMTLTPGQPLGGASTYFNAIFPIEGLGVGMHTLTVKVKSMNGGEPTGNTDDDAATTNFRVYQHAAKHQQSLIEHFTSQFCSNCHYGYDLLRTMTKDNNDYAWVAVHGDMSTGKDVYTLADAGYITQYSISGFPYANFDRGYYGGGYLGVGIGYKEQQHSQIISELKENLDAIHESFPSMVRLNLSGNYDSANKKYVVTVTGTGIEKASNIISDYTVSLYVTESGLKGRQNNDGKWSLQYDHENVLRAIVSEPWGDEIEWNGDNFTKTFEFAVDDEWNADNLTAVAFVSKPFVYTVGEKSYWDNNIDQMAINQCQSLKLSTEGTQTGINGVENANGATVVARFAADGTQISAPVKGLNIVKFSDGTTRKVVIK